MLKMINDWDGVNLDERKLVSKCGPREHQRRWGGEFPIANRNSPLSFQHGDPCRLPSFEIGAWFRCRRFFPTRAPHDTNCLNEPDRFALDHFQPNTRLLRRRANGLFLSNRGKQQRAFAIQFRRASSAEIFVTVHTAHGELEIRNRRCIHIFFFG